MPYVRRFKRQITLWVSNDLSDFIEELSVNQKRTHSDVIREMLYFSMKNMKIGG